MTQRELETRLAKLEALLPATRPVPLVVATPCEGGYEAVEHPGLVKTFPCLADLIGHYRPMGSFIITTQPQE